MEKYSILIQWDGGQWIATVPEFGNGVRGYGDTRNEALTQAVAGIDDTVKAYQRAGVALPAANEI